MRAPDTLALEALLTEALAVSDRLEQDQVGAHIAMAVDALRREAVRGRHLPVRRPVMLHAIER